MKKTTFLAGSMAFALAVSTALLPAAAYAGDRPDGGSHVGGHGGAMHAAAFHHNGGYHGRYAHRGYYGGGYYARNYYGGGYYGACGPIPNVLGFCVPLPFGL